MASCGSKPQVGGKTVPSSWAADKLSEKDSEIARLRDLLSRTSHSPEHERRVIELLGSNNALLQRARDAEAALAKMTERRDFYVDAHSRLFATLNFRNREFNGLVGKVSNLEHQRDSAVKGAQKMNADMATAKSEAEAWRTLLMSPTLPGAQFVPAAELERLRASDAALEPVRQARDDLNRELNRTRAELDAAKARIAEFKRDMYGYAYSMGADRLHTAEYRERALRDEITAWQRRYEHAVAQASAIAGMYPHPTMLVKGVDPGRGDKTVHPRVVLITPEEDAQRKADAKALAVVRTAVAP